MRGTSSRRKSTASKNRYYKWSWRWYLSNQCGAYKNAVSAKNKARQDLTTAKKCKDYEKEEGQASSTKATIPYKKSRSKERRWFMVTIVLEKIYEAMLSWRNV
jgi:hypothetical protein